jgi:hypothetical protein
MSVTNVCKRLVMRISTSKYRQALSAIIADPPAPRHAERSTLLCSARVLGFGLFVVRVTWSVAGKVHRVCWTELTDSSSYGESCVLEGTE